MKNSLEGIVIKWAYQINDVLKEDSSTAFKDGAQPSPLEEIIFWDSRQSNLRNIYTQLLEPRVKQIGVILEGIDSVYYSSFKSTFQSVVQAVHEADDITLYLKPLVSGPLNPDLPLTAYHPHSASTLKPSRVPTLPTRWN